MKRRSAWRAGRTIAATLLVLLLALAAHLPLWLQYRHDPFSETLISDALSYDRWARSIARNGVAGEPVFHQAPLFPLLLASVYAGRPDAGPRAALPLQILLGAIAICLLVPLGTLYLGDPWAGVLAALLALLHGPVPFYSLKLIPVTLALATQALALVALGFALSRDSSPLRLVAGLTLGVAALARSEVLLFAPVAIVALWPRGDPARARSKLLALLPFVIGLTVGIAPATAHNLRQGDLTLIASSAGENLFIGNQRGAKGGHAALHPQAGDILSQRELAGLLAERARSRKLKPSEVSAYWRNRAIEEVLADPGGWIALELRKLGRILAPGDPTDIYSYPLERRLYLGALHALPLPPWTLLLAGIAGAVLALRRLPSRAWPLAAFCLVHTAVLMVFFVSSRLRLPLLFFLSAFGGYALLEGWRTWRAGRRGPVIAGAVVLLAGSLVSAVAVSRIPSRELVRLASVLSQQNRLDEALGVLEPVLAAGPADGLLLDQAGWILQRQGRWAAAARRYEQALAAGTPGGREHETLTRLAQVLERLGQPGEAARRHDSAVASPGANAGTFHERGMFRVRTGDVEGAVRDLERAAALDPGWDAPREALRRLSR